MSKITDLLICSRNSIGILYDKLKEASLLDECEALTLDDTLIKLDIEIATQRQYEGYNPLKEMRAEIIGENFTDEDFKSYDPATPESTANLSKISDKNEWLDEVRGREESAEEKIKQRILDAYYDGFNQAHYSHVHPEICPPKECESAGKEYMIKNKKWIDADLASLVNERKDNAGFSYSVEDIDLAYITGAFNAAGINGLQKELKRIKKVGKQPHNIIDFLKSESKTQNSNVGVSDAIEFANWIYNNYCTIGNLKWIRIGLHGEYLNATELYKIFLESQPQQKEV